MGQTGIDVSGLSRSFGGKRALEGMRAQAGLIAAVAHRPELLILLDEVERMSDHVTLMHQGRVTLSGVLDDVRGSYQRSRVRFVEHFDKPPALETASVTDGSGRTWSVVHSGSIGQFRHSVLARGGEVVESRDATLEEVFLARAGRSRQQVEAV